MKRKWIVIAGLIVVLGAAAGGIAYAAGQGDLGKLRAATAQFHDLDDAIAAGYGLVPGLDYCFVLPSVGGMGFHYIDTAGLDTELDPTRPEALVYFPDAGGRLKLGAVEFIVPEDAWLAAGNTEPPAVLGQSLHLNGDLHVYVLHAWIWKNNPAGIFEDWNPNVSCP